MKHHKYKSSRGTTFNHEKYRAQKWKQEHDAGGFRCSHCKEFVVINDIMGTANRNHCNICLWSKHVDTAKGDRKATCQAGMRPVGLTFKHEGQNKIGEVMLIHACMGCEKISINRLARDDLDSLVLDIFEVSKRMEPDLRNRCQQGNIYIMSEGDEEELHRQLFGN